MPIARTPRRDPPVPIGFSSDEVLEYYRIEPLVGIGFGQIFFRSNPDLGCAAGLPNAIWRSNERWQVCLPASAHDNSSK